MVAVSPYSSPPRSPRSAASLHQNSLPSDLVDTRIKVILLSAFDEDSDGLQKLLDDPSCHRSGVVRSEKISVYVYIDKAVVQQCQWNQSDIDSMIVDITLHECQAPSTKSRYYPSSDSSSNIHPDSADKALKARPSPVIFPEGSVCYIVEISIGEGAYDEIRAHIQLPARANNIDDVSRIDIDDLSVFKSATPGCNLLKTLSRNEERGAGIVGQRFLSSLKIEMIEPLQIEWDREILESTVFWSIRVRNRLQNEAMVIHRVRLLFSSLEESLVCMNRDRLPISLQPEELYCFVFSVSNSCKSIPLTSLTLQSATLSSPIMYQVQLTVKDRDEAPLSVHLECAPEVLNHSTFSVAVTISNSGPTIRNLDLKYEPARPDNESVVKPFLSLDKCIDIGTLVSGQTTSATLHFLALREGLISLSNITIMSRSSGEKFVQDRPLVILVTRELVAN